MVFKNKRQVVIINDIKSDSIEQAIFILRDRKNNKEKSIDTSSDIVLEAERIINSFLCCSDKNNGVFAAVKKPPKSRREVIIGGLLWLASATAVVGLSVLILSFI